MKITHVRVGMLESGPDYNNQSITLEAQVEDAENYEDVAADLRAKCKSQIKGAKEIESAWNRVNDLRETIAYNENEIARIRAKIAHGQKIIREHEKIGEIAAERGIKNELFDELPF